MFIHALMLLMLLNFGITTFSTSSVGAPSSLVVGKMIFLFQSGE